ncbi:MAG: glycosyltransferase [Chloroflexales bacterium]|nr:glycosyltransferase [Chloroflexales bacterium]
MRVLHVTTNDQSGGAARAAYRLHRGLRAIGVDSTVFCAERDSDDPTVRAIGQPDSRTVQLARRVRYELIERAFRPYRQRRPAGLEPFTDDRSRYGEEFVRKLPPADLITLHWVAGFLDYRAFFSRVPQRTPVVWRLSDMNAFTGGCHYDEECGRYVAACGACPQLSSREPDDLSHQIWRRKRLAFDRVAPGRLHIVALNQWIAGEVRRSALLQNVPVHYIPNGLDTEAFAPRDRAFARQVLGLPPQARVVLFVAGTYGNRRKGFALLSEALAGMDDMGDLILLSIGRGSGQVEGGIPHVALGALSQDHMLSLVYSAADVFAIPSLQDNMPSTALEAIACGTPVVGFDVGGVPEMVRPQVTGLLAPKGDVAGLRAALRRLLDDAALRRALSERCRQIALAEYTLEIQARRYQALYETILGPRHVQAEPVGRVLASPASGKD